MDKGVGAKFANAPWEVKKYLNNFLIIIFFFFFFFFYIFFTKILKTLKSKKTFPFIGIGIFKSLYILFCVKTLLIIVLTISPFVLVVCFCLC